MLDTLITQYGVAKIPYPEGINHCKGVDLIDYVNSLKADYEITTHRDYWLIRGQSDKDYVFGKWNYVVHTNGKVYKMHNEDDILMYLGWQYEVSSETGKDVTQWIPF